MTGPLKKISVWRVLLAVMQINVLIYTQQTKVPNVVPMYKVEIDSDHCSELTPNCIGIIYEIATVNIKGIECVFIYRTYHIMSHGGLQFY